MKKLILLRHAEAETTLPSDQDLHRSLTSKGIDQAFDVGLFLKEAKKIPDFILTSNAIRTLQTMEQVTKALGMDIKFEKNPMLFRCSVDDLIEQIRGFSDAYQTVLIINHNPVIHELALELSRINLNLSNRDDFSKIENNYPPATVASIDCDIKSWDDFDQVFCTLLRTHITL